MESLNHSFQELRHRLKSGRTNTLTGGDPVYYLVFPPELMLAVKQSMKKWRAALAIDGWTVETFSMAAAVQDLLQQNDLRDLWLESEADDPQNFKEINDTLRDALIAGDSLQKQLEEKLGTLKGKDMTVLFVTDLEALHPYLRVGTLEQRLQSKFTVPTVILYPGLRSGKTSLRFLGIYPEDGNYRSMHIGG